MKSHFFIVSTQHEIGLREICIICQIRTYRYKIKSNEKEFSTDSDFFYRNNMSKTLITYRLFARPLRVHRPLVFTVPLGHEYFDNAPRKLSNRHAAARTRGHRPSCSPRASTASTKVKCEVPIQTIRMAEFVYWPVGGRHSCTTTATAKYGNAFSTLT